ncbi:MAG: serine/threonine-protein kinase [Myxococcota bacterium]
MKEDVPSAEKAPIETISWWPDGDGSRRDADEQKFEGIRLAPGTIVDQRYEVLDVLGSGGQAVVYRVRHLHLDTWHALKVVTNAHGAACERILREGRLQASLMHPHVVRVTDVVTCRGAPALIMDFIDGPDLAAVIARQPVPLRQADNIGRAILSAVSAAHDRGLVHRDLKPENVLLAKGEDGLVTPLVTDFGLAVHLAFDRRTATGTVMGTPYYMSPEQVRDGKRVDARTDIWALGALLYEMLARQVAFSGATVFEVWSAVEQAKPVPLRDLVPDVPDRMVLAIEGALRQDPNDRLQTCAEMLELWSGATQSRSSVLRFTMEFAPTPEPVEAQIQPTVIPLEETGHSEATSAWYPSYSLVWQPLTTLGVALAFGFGFVAILGFGAHREPSSPRPDERGADDSVSDWIVPPSQSELESPLPPATIDVETSPSRPKAVSSSGRLSGKVGAEGATVHLECNGVSYRIPGSIPVGVCEVWVDFDGTKFRYPRLLNVAESTLTNIICSPGTQLCVYRTEEHQP